MDIIGASGDHVILDSGNRRIAVGAEIEFRLNYGVVLRAMTSLFVPAIANGRKHGVRKSRVERLEDLHDLLQRTSGSVSQMVHPR